MERLCESTFLGFGMITLHSTVVTSTKFDFHLYNPRTPPKDAVNNMAKKMQVSCLSDEFPMTAAVSRAAVTNISNLLSVYSPPHYTTIHYAEFRADTTVFFLTGGTRNQASGKAFQSMRPSTGKPKTAQVKDEEKNTVRSAPLFKVTNWVVKLYDYGAYIQCLYLYILILLDCPLNMIQMSCLSWAVRLVP
jgi:hypothetical protein